MLRKKHIDYAAVALWIFIVGACFVEVFGAESVAYMAGGLAFGGAVMWLYRRLPD